MMQVSSRAMYTGEGECVVCTQIQLSRRIPMEMEEGPQAAQERRRNTGGNARENPFSLDVFEL